MPRENKFRQKPRRGKKVNRYYVNVNAKGNRRKPRFNLATFFKAATHTVIVISFFLILTYLGIELYRFVITDQLFDIKEIYVENNVTVTEKEIVDAIGIGNAQNLFTLDLSYCMEQLEKFPNIKTASIVKKLPDTLIIRIYEREPVFQLYNGCYFYVDKEGVVLARMTRSPDPSLPVVSGITIPVIDFGARVENKELRLALKAVEAYNKSKVRKRLEINTIDISQPEKVELIASKNGRVVLGKKDFEYRLTKLNKIVDDLRRRKLAFVSIDLRFENVPVVIR